MATYLCCWLGGGALGIAVCVLLAGREGLPRLRVLVGMVGLGLVFYAGARAHAVLLEEGRPLKALVEEPQLWFGWGLRLPGGLLASVLVVPLLTLWLGLPYWRFSDIAVTGGGVFFAVGRLGCHVAGCCFGVPSSLPWAISYGRGSVPYAVHLQRGLIAENAPASLLVHPFALYLSLAGCGVFVFLLWLGRRGVREGTRMLAGLTLYGMAFGIIEGLRDGGGDGPALYRQELWLTVGLGAGVMWLARSYLWRIAGVPNRAWGQPAPKG